MGIGDRNEITFLEIGALSTETDLCLPYPVILILLGFATWMLFHNSSPWFHHNHSMESLKKSEVENCSQIIPVLSLNLLEQNLDEGPWAMVKLSLDFFKEHHVLEITKINKKV
ncbi:hypothetical protein [Candidatus Coxiella mudrowiae]|uniref:hypothetical protein n=1 Tax=Candidatus Coxiella mudrowiae TaxID=2054173 RepID=UPI001F33383E|nr:hypothetical protein [Candidatus Coxiella mudrowiae]